jgi:NodT family efflux transporter outer membrane factor (OMF) lipoprotein
VSRRLALAGALTVALSACTAGPDYHVPEGAAARAPAANGAFLGVKDRAFAAAPLPDHWWRLYDDALLDSLVTEGLSANTDLRAADANLRAASAVVREAEAGRTVQTTLSGGATLARPYGTGAGLPGQVGYDLGGGLSYPLDLAGRIRRQIESARADAEATEAARDEVRVTVAAAVTRSYAATCTANVRIAAANRVIGIQQQTFAATQRLFRGGRDTAFDVTRAQAAVEQSRAQLPALIAARQASLFELAALLGRAPADYPRAVESCRKLPLVRSVIPVGDGAALIRRRPDIRQAERSLASATAQIGVATASLYPQVSLGGSAGFTGPLSPLNVGTAFNLSLGPLISWSFPNRIAVRAQIAAAGANADAALARFDGTVLEGLRQTETALSAYARTRDQVNDLTRARDSAARAVAQADRLTRFGRGTFLDTLSAQATLASAEASLASAQTALVDAEVDLFLALGGGWTPDTAEPVPTGK